MCLNCLSDRHTLSKCKSKHSCSVCGFRLNTLLHRQKGESANAPLIYSASPLQGQELNPNTEEFHSSQESTAYGDYGDIFWAYGSRSEPPSHIRKIYWNDCGLYPASM
ncbi:hypothetical protein TNCV_4236121 [Trichonephila clavipes]|nr:hypothetical protein TNCV_4236121 [Trichonephila clavipes]